MFPTRYLSLSIFILLLSFSTITCDDGGDGDADSDVDGDGDADGDVDGDTDSDADEDEEVDLPLPPPSEDMDRDIISTALQIDLETQSGIATIVIAPSAGTGASFEAQGLEITTVGDGGRELNYEIVEGRLDIGVPLSDEPATIVIEYEYEYAALFEGAMPNGSTLTWPYHCGNLFPCHSDPADGLTFELEVDGAQEGLEAIYPAEIIGAGPAYGLAWAVGEYDYIDLGETTAGTQVGVWHYPDDAERAATGAEHLNEFFDWFETNIGGYNLATAVGAVTVSWGPGAVGGMEHHPIWHISSNGIHNPNTQAHEAAHGWFGNGIRIACWEDFVLSEGTVTYLAAVVQGEFEGDEVEEATWEGYRARLDRAMSRSSLLVAWPDSCGEVDILEDGLFGDIPYMKGALFFKALEGRVGRDTVVAALAAFYEEYQGTAAGMQDLLDTISVQTGYDPTDCAQAWLREEDLPTEAVCPEDE